MVMTNDGGDNTYLKFFILGKLSICVQTNSEKSNRSQYVVY
jgi:hypothetical protein